MSGPNEIDAYIGGRIRRIREFRGISRDVVAAALDMTSTDFGILDRGLKRPSAEQITTIADVLRVRPSYLFSNMPPRAEDEDASTLLPFHEDLVGNLTESLSQ